MVARDRAYQAHGARALVLEQVWRFADAVADWDRVVEFAAAHRQLDVRVNRAATLARAGRHGARAVDGDAEAPLGGTQLGGQRRVGGGLGIGRQGRLEASEHVEFTVAGVVGHRVIRSCVGIVVLLQVFPAVFVVPRRVVLGGRGGVVRVLVRGLFLCLGVRVRVVLVLVGGSLACLLLA